jgi:hypothetical protein
LGGAEGDAQGHRASCHPDQPHPCLFYNVLC